MDNELIEKLLAYYKENIEDFNNDIEELDDWNGFLYEDRIFPMEELNIVFQGFNPENIIRRAFYGYDETYKERLPFNPNREYFYFNAYGNLVSIDKKDYSEYLYEDLIQEIIDNEAKLVLSEGAQNLIDNYEDENE